MPETVNNVRLQHKFQETGGLLATKQNGERNELVNSMLTWCWHYHGVDLVW